MQPESTLIIIPTYNAVNHVPGFSDTLKHLIACKHKVLVVDSSSSDDTPEVVKKMGVELISIPQSEFNHGATREFARRLKKSEFVIFMTQDVYVASEQLIERLIEPMLQDTSVAASYARQIAHDGAGVFESFPRDFNYPKDSQIRCLDDISEYGVYTFFCSNSCAAYRSSALDEIGGFITTLASEDYFAVAQLLEKGYKIAYVAEAVVKHSHSYTLIEEFKRYFDVGYVRAKNPAIQKIVGQAEARGGAFFQNLVKFLFLQRLYYLIPYAVLQTGFKWLGYRTGFYGQFIPKKIRKYLSGQPYFWSSKYYF